MLLSSEFCLRHMICEKTFPPSVDNCNISGICSDSSDRPELKWMMLEMPKGIKNQSIAKCYKVIDHFESEGKEGHGVGISGKKIFKLFIN